MVLKHTDNVKVFSLVADRMAACGKIYWYIRTVDTTGKGRATVKLKDLTKYFDVLLPTIYRWLKGAKSLGYLHDYKLHRDGSVTVIYRTYKIFLEMFNLESLGQAVWCNRAQMRNLKNTATIAELQTKQNQSLHMSRKANKANIGRADTVWRSVPYEQKVRLNLLGKVRTIWRRPDFIFDQYKKVEKQRRLADPSIKPILKNKPAVDISPKAQKYFEPKKITRRNKVVKHVGDRFAIVTHKMIPIGVTQLSVATGMNRCVATVRNRTKAIERRQILRILPIFVDTGEIMNRDDTKILVHDGVCYEACPNIYKFGGQYETSSAYIYSKRAKAYQKAMAAKSPH